MAGTGLAQDHLVTLISFLNMDVMNVPRLTIPTAMQQLDDQGKLKNFDHALILREDDPLLPAVLDVYNLVVFAD